MDPSTIVSSMFAQQDPIASFVSNLLLKSTSSESWRQLFFDLIRSVPKIILAILIKHYLANTQNVVSFLKQTSWTYISAASYTVVEFDKREPLNGFVLTQLTDTINDGEIKNLLPIYYEVNGNRIILKYFRPAHHKFVSEILARAQIAFDENRARSAATTSIYCRYDDRYKVATVSEMFPSRNYRRLEGVVERYIRVSNLTKAYRVLGILINGIPGLGKSSFADYITTKGVVPKVHRADLSSRLSLNTEPGQLFDRIFFDISIAEDSIFMIDEMDKYIDYYVDSSYERLPAPAEGQKKIAKKDHVKRIKTDFLYTLLGVLERSGLPASCIVVFCSNNFNTLFDGLDTTHFQSIKDRFVQVEFNEIDKEELVDYLNYYNDKFVGTELSVSQEVMNGLKERIPDDLQITYRRINQISTLASYDPVAIVDKVLSYHRSGSPIFNLGCIADQDEFEDSEDKELVQIVDNLELVHADPESDSDSEEADAVSKDDEIKANSEGDIEVKDESDLDSEEAKDDPKDDQDKDDSDSDSDELVSSESDDNSSCMPVTPSIPSYEKALVLHSGFLPDETNPDKFVNFYLCNSCTFACIEAKNLCNCRICAASETVKLTNRFFQITCHYCLTKEEYTDYIQPYVGEDFYDRNLQFVVVIQSYLDAAKKHNNINEKKLIVVSLFDLIAKDQNMEVLNSRGGCFSSFHVAAFIKKILEFAVIHPGFLSANSAFFETLLRKVRLDPHDGIKNLLSGTHFQIIWDKNKE